MSESVEHSFNVAWKHMAMCWVGWMVKLYIHLPFLVSILPQKKEKFQRKKKKFLNISKNSLSGFKFPTQKKTSKSFILRKNSFDLFSSNKLCTKLHFLNENCIKITSKFLYYKMEGKKNFSRIFFLTSFEKNQSVLFFTLLLVQSN